VRADSHIYAQHFRPIPAECRIYVVVRHRFGAKTPRRVDLWGYVQYSRAQSAPRDGSAFAGLGGVAPN